VLESATETLLDGVARLELRLSGLRLVGETAAIVELPQTQNDVNVLKIRMDSQAVSNLHLLHVDSQAVTVSVLATVTCMATGT
jgi:hypothetical protein